MHFCAAIDPEFRDIFAVSKIFKNIICLWKELNKNTGSNGKQAFFNKKSKNFWIFKTVLFLI